MVSLGKYYRNAKWSGAPVDVQIDPVIDFDWAKTMPLPPPFSVEWTGQLLVEQPGEYTFAVVADDGAVLEIDGREVMNGPPAFLEEKVVPEVGARSSSDPGALLQRFVWRFGATVVT